MIAELDMEALDVAHECEVTRQEFEAASAELKNAEARFTEELENVDVVVEEYASLRNERDTFEEQERSLAAEIDGPQLSGSQTLQECGSGEESTARGETPADPGQSQETESWMATTESDYQRACEKVELAATELEKLRRNAQWKERELSDWLVPESKWFTKELENFRTLHASISTSLDAMRDGLDDGWEGTLGNNPVFLGSLGGYAIHPEMVANSKDWAPIIESFFLSQVSLALSKEMSKFHSAMLQRLELQEESAQREWRKGVEDIFGQRAPSFKKSSLPQLIPLPECDVAEDPISPAGVEPGPVAPRDLPPPPPPLHGHEEGVMSVVFSPDGTKIISASYDATLRVWDASTGQMQKVLWGHSDRCHCVAISGDGSWIVSGSQDKTVRTWNATTGKMKRTFLGHRGVVEVVACSWNGTRICSWSTADQTVRVWDAMAGAMHVLAGHPGGISPAAFSRDGKWLALGAWDHTIKIWDASSTTASLRNVLQGHASLNSPVAVSMDGTWIVSGLSDKTVNVWDASTGNLVRILEHAGDSTAIAISPDGKKVVSGSYDGTLRVWDASTGKLLTVSKGHSYAVWSVSISPDGRRFASGSDDDTIRIWDLSTSASSSH